MGSGAGEEGTILARLVEWFLDVSVYFMIFAHMFIYVPYIYPICLRTYDDHVPVIKSLGGRRWKKTSHWSLLDP